MELQDTHQINPQTNGTSKNDEKQKCIVLYKVDDVPPWYLCAFLGFQHFLTMFGSTVAYPYLIAPYLCIGDNSPARAYLFTTALFASGISTLLQTCFGVRLPIIQGASFAYLAPTYSLLSIPKWQCSLKNETFSNFTNGSTNYQTDDEEWMLRMREVQGSIAVATVLQVFLGATGIVGIVLKFITPLTIAPTITLIGLSLLNDAISLASKDWAVAVCTILLMITFSQYLRNFEIPCFVYRRKKGCSKISFPLFKLFPVLLSLVTMWLACLTLTSTDYFPHNHPSRTDLRSQLLQDTTWVHIPYPGQWGVPTVSLAGIMGMLGAAIATIIESVGDYYACARLCGASAPPTHAVNRGIVTEGLGSIITALFGSGSATTSYAENIGAIGITKVGSRRAVQTAACILLIIGMISKFGAVFVSIPDPILGGLYCVMFSMVAAVGISNVQFIDLNSSRNLFILGFSIFIGLGIPVWISSNKDLISTGNESADQIIIVILSTKMLIGGLLGFLLDNTIPGSVEERGTNWLEKEAVEMGFDNMSTYDLPFGMKLIRKWAWTKYVPLCPTFNPVNFKWPFRYRKCKVCNQPNNHVNNV